MAKLGILRFHLQAATEREGGCLQHGKSRGHLSPPAGASSLISFCRISPLASPSWPLCWVHSCWGEYQGPGNLQTASLFTPPTTTVIGSGLGVCPSLANQCDSNPQNSDWSQRDTRPNCMHRVVYTALGAWDRLSFLPSGLKKLRTKAAAEVPFAILRGRSI